MAMRTFGGFGGGADETELVMSLFAPKFYAELQRKNQEAYEKFIKDRESAELESAKKLREHEVALREQGETRKSQELGVLLTKLKERANLQLINPPPLTTQEEGLYTQYLPEIQRALAARTNIPDFIRSIEEANIRERQSADAKLLTEQNLARKSGWMPAGQGTLVEVGDQGLKSAFMAEQLKAVQEQTFTEIPDGKGGTIKIPAGTRTTTATYPGHMYNPRTGGALVGNINIQQRRAAVPTKAPAELNLDLNSALSNEGNLPGGETEGMSGNIPSPTTGQNLNPQAVDPSKTTIAPRNSVGQSLASGISKSLTRNLFETGIHDVLTKAAQVPRNWATSLYNAIDAPDRVLREKQQKSFQDKLQTRAGINPPMGNIPYAPVESLGESLLPGPSQQEMVGPQLPEAYKFLLTKPRGRRIWDPIKMKYSLE